MRLIDADALAEKKFQERECNGLGEGPAYRQGWNDAIDAVMDNEPSVQPEIIRCRECEYGKWDIGDRGMYCGRKHVELDTYEDFFCAAANRREVADGNTD